jgi:hypothetical protein
VSSAELSVISASKEVPLSPRTRNVSPTQTSQDTFLDTFPSLRLHNTEEFHAQQLHRTTSFQQLAKPSIYSAPPSKQPGISVSSSISRVPPALTKPTSSLARPPRVMLSSESRAQSGGAPVDLPRPPDQEKRTTTPDELRHTHTSAASHELPSLPQPVITKVDPIVLPQPEIRTHRLGRSKSHMLGNEGLEREAMQAAARLTSDKKEPKRTTVAEGHETRREDSAADSNGAARQRAEPSPPSTYAPHVKRYPQPPQESSIKRTYSSSISHDSDSSSVHLPDANGSRGKARRPLGPVPLSDRTETSITQPLASLSTPNQPKSVVRVPSNNYSTFSSADYRSRPPNVGEFQLRTTPSMSPSMKPSNSMRPTGQPLSAAIPDSSQDELPNTRILREPGGDTLSRPPDHHGETHESFRVQDSTHETVENMPHVKPSDRKGLNQASSKSSIISHQSSN